MLRLKHAPSPQGGSCPGKEALLSLALARLDLLTPASQQVSTAQAIRTVVESVRCEGLSLAAREVAVLLDGRVRPRAERRGE